MKNKFKILSVILIISFAIIAIVFIFKPKTIEWKNETMYIVNVSDDMRLVMQKDIYEKFKRDGAECFISGQLANFRKAASPEYDLQKKPRIIFYVLHVGEDYKRLTGLPFERGIGGQPELGALAVDDQWFFSTAPKGLACDRLRIGLVHEHAHIILDAFNKNNSDSAFDEGFAELIPFYLADMEGQDEQNQQEKRTDIIKNMKSDDIYTLDWAMNNCMWCIESEKYAQYRKTYISMYLWTRGYIDMIEKKYNLNKVDAFNFIMKKWGDLPEYETRKEWITAIANIIDLSLEDVLYSKKLQLLGQQIIKDNY